jgi:hypothetical protein
MPTPGVSRRFTRWCAAASSRPSSSAGVASGGWTASSSTRTSSACTSRRPTGRASTHSSAPRRKSDGHDRGEPQEPPCPHRRPAPCLAQVVLGHLQVVAANRFDRAIAAAPVDQLHPDGLAPPGKLAESERQLVPARGRHQRRRVRPAGRPSPRDRTGSDARCRRSPAGQGTPDSWRPGCRGRHGCRRTPSLRCRPGGRAAPTARWHRPRRGPRPRTPARPPGAARPRTPPPTRRTPAASPARLTRPVPPVRAYPAA